jgi:hypothetical protein
MSSVFIVSLPQFIDVGKIKSKKDNLKLSGFLNEVRSLMDVDVDLADVREKNDTYALPALHLIKKIIAKYDSNILINHNEVESENALFVTFSCSEGNAHEILEALHKFGIGEKFGKIDIVHPMLSFDSKKTQNNSSLKKKNAMIVEQVLRQVRERTVFSVDLIIYLSIACILAGIGIALNDSFVILAATFVSPMVGPILSACFAASIHDWTLMKQAIKLEAKFLITSIFLGFISGCIFSPFQNELGWPTNAMLSKGKLWGLLLGIVLGIPSGLGVAFSILGSNTESLLGLSVSISLLSPCVNSGMLLAYSLFGSTTDSISSSSLAFYGLISLLLALINIVVIFFSALAVLKIKKVGPIKDNPELWSRRLTEFLPRDSTLLHENYISLDSVISEQDKRKTVSDFLYRKDTFMMKNTENI